MSFSSFEGIPPPAAPPPPAPPPLQRSIVPLSTPSPPPGPPPPPKPCDEYNINENDDGCILGEGGFGVVTREKCGFKLIKCKGKYVAKKILTRHDTSTEVLVKQEKRIYEQLSKNPSEYVLNMYGSIINEENTKVTQYFEYIGGKELFEYEEKRFISDIVIGLIKGLKHIHDQNVIHCDVKPENIIIDTSKEPYRPVYIDFGGSITTSQKDNEGVLTTEGIVAGLPITTPFFREAIAKYEPNYVTARTDVYALLITLTDSPIRYNEDDSENAFIEEVRNLKILQAFTRFWNNGDIIYDHIWRSWKFITNKIENISSPPRVTVNNINHNNPPSFYTRTPVEREIKSMPNPLINKIKDVLTPRARGRKTTSELRPQGMRYNIDRDEMEKEDIHVSEQRMMEKKLMKEKALTQLKAEPVKKIKRTLSFKKAKVEEPEELKRTVAFKKAPEELKRTVAFKKAKEEEPKELKRTVSFKRAKPKRNSKRNSKTSRISTTQQDMNGYIGGVSKKKFRRSSKKIRKIRNRRRSTKKRR